MSKLSAIFILVGLISLHYRFADSFGLKKLYFPVLALKFSAGFGVGLIYFYHYGGGDTWNYFNQAVLFKQIAFSSWSNFKELFWFNKYELIVGFAYTNQPRAAFMVKLVAIVNILSNDNYWLTSAFFSLFSFVGVWKFANWVHQNYSLNPMAILLLLLWPSFLFWSSGVLKEAVAVGLIFWIVVVFLMLFENKISVVRLLSLLLALYTLFLIKYYFAVVLIITLFVYGSTRIIGVNNWQKSYQILAWILTVVLGAYLGSFLHPNLELNNIIGVIINNHDVFVSKSAEGSIIHFNPNSSPWQWILTNSPKALFAGLFLPLTFNSSNLFYSMASLENWALLFLTLMGLWNAKLKYVQTNSSMILASATYILTLAVFLALSTPNLGSLIRFKVAYIPVLLAIILSSNSFFKKQAM